MTDTKKISDAFDPAIFAEAVSDTAVMAVRHPITGEPTAWEITFAGPGHPQQQALADRLLRKILREQQERERARVNGKKYKPADREPEDVRRENIEIVVDQIVTWTGCTVAFSRDAAVTMLADPRYGKVLVQINEFLDNEQVFTRTSATT